MVNKTCLNLYRFWNASGTIARIVCERRIHREVGYSNRKEKYDGELQTWFRLLDG